MRTEATVPTAMSNNAKTALVLASIAAVFFLGVILKHWILG